MFFRGYQHKRNFNFPQVRVGAIATSITHFGAHC
jgi:hypothetical protein